MASLQNSMPVQAIVFCRQSDGRAGRPMPSSAADQRLDLLRRDADQHDLLVRREAGARDAVLLHQVGELDQLGAGDPARDGRDADVEVAVLLLVHADVVAVADGGGRGVAADELAAEVLLLEHLAELLDAPVGDQELQPGARAQPAVAVVAEDRGDALPDVGHVRRVGTQTPSFWASIGLVDRPPPTQTSKPGPCTGCTVPTKAMSLVSGETSWLGWPVSAVLYLRGRLENSGLPIARRLISASASEPSMISSLATPATGEPRNGRGESPQASVLSSPAASSRCPDRRDVLDPDPVELDVLPVGDVGGVPGVLLADLAERPHRGGGQQPAVGADPHHEELVVELLLLEHRGLAAVEAGGALGVEPHPAEPAAQVGRVDRVRSRAWSRCAGSGRGR